MTNPTPSIAQAAGEPVAFELEAAKGVHSGFNACMYREQCRAAIAALTPSASSVPVALPIPFAIDRTHKNRAFVTLGFMTEQECDAFIKATRTDGLFSTLLQANGATK